MALAFIMTRLALKGKQSAHGYEDARAPKNIPTGSANKKKGSLPNKYGSVQVPVPWGGRLPRLNASTSWKEDLNSLDTKVQECEEFARSVLNEYVGIASKAGRNSESVASFEQYASIVDERLEMTTFCVARKKHWRKNS